VLRLFVGIGLPELVKDALLGLTEGIPGANWISHENYHITLRYLGEMPESDAADIDATLSGLAAPAFDLELAGVGHFGPLRKARALWAAVPANSALVHLRNKVEAACVRAGAEPEHRKFKPHVTLARIKGETGHHLADYLARHNMFAAGPFLVGQFTLFHSYRTSSGSVYEPLADYALSGAPAAEDTPELSSV
jgi:2'-5' RNA ligase